MVAYEKCSCLQKSIGERALGGGHAQSAVDDVRCGGAAAVGAGQVADGPGGIEGERDGICV